MKNLILLLIAGPLAASVTTIERVRERKQRCVLHTLCSHNDSLASSSLDSL